MEFFSIIVEKIADYTIEPVARQVGYVIYLKRNVDNLNSEVEKLVDAKGRVQHSVDEALRKCHKIEADVEKWLKKVDETIAEANEFLKDENQVKKKCLFGLCPSLISSRYCPSRKATKLAQKVVEIQKGGAFPNGVSYTTPPEDIWTSGVGYYQAFESRLLIVTEIMKELKDSNNHRIGVYGMPGVGKSTLVEEIAMRAEEQKLFKVAKVEVKQDTDLKRIQKEIAQKFGLELNENLTIAGRARFLTDYIKKNKNILVILDDVWEMLDLKTLGLPFGICKLLLTSRKRDILSSEIGTQKEFRLKVLDEEESWSLFKNIVADDVKDPGIQETAIQVSKRCAGLPILVVAFANVTELGEKQIATETKKKRRTNT